MGEHLDPYTEPVIVNDPTGSVYGIPTFHWGDAPRDVYATRRQLAALGLRAGGRAPDALMRRTLSAWRNPVSYLYLIAECVPRRPWTPAKEAAVWTAARSRYRCDGCPSVWPDLTYIPREGLCEDCRDTTTSIRPTHQPDQQKAA